LTYFGGLTEHGKIATQSHTASLSGNSKVLSAALKQSLIIQPRSENELLTFLKLFDILAHKKKKPFGENRITFGRVVVLSISGGHGALCADLLKKYGLTPVIFTEEEKRSMRKLTNPVAREIASFNNPIDLTGSVQDEDIEHVLLYLSKIERIECIILLILPYAPSISFQIGRRISNTISIYKKPVVCFIPYIKKYSLIIEALELANIPVLHSIKGAVQAVSALKVRTRILNLKEDDTFWEQI